MRPSRRPSSPRGSRRRAACLTCDKFATDATHLPDHEHQLDRLIDLIDGRKQAFRTKTGQEMSDDNVWLEQRHQEQRALERIIAALQQPEIRAKGSHAVRGAGVGARTAQTKEEG